MKKCIFSAKQQAKVLATISRYGIEGEIDLWGNLETGKVEYSEDSEEYSEMKNSENHVYITNIFDFQENVYFIYENYVSDDDCLENGFIEEGIKELIEENWLQDKIVEI